MSKHNQEKIKKDSSSVGYGLALGAGIWGSPGSKNRRGFR